MADAAVPGETVAEKPVGGRDLLIVLAAGLAIFILLTAAVGAYMFAFLPSPEAARALAGKFDFVVGSTAVTDIALLAVVWWRAKRLSPHPMARFFAPVEGRALFLAALSALALMAVFAAAETLAKWLTGNSFSLSSAETALMPTSPGQLFAILAAGALIGPFFEEFLFRGFLLGWLKRIMAIWPAIFVSSAAFALMHFQLFLRSGLSGWFGGGEIFAIGVLLGWWAHRSGSLQTCFVVHAVNNGAAFLIYFAVPAWR
jgi:membrane protease YdiL (CAAX protease family)